MSCRGNCWDNAVAESFCGRLKEELVHWKNYQTRAQAQQDVLDYIVMFYNSERLHSYLDHRTQNKYCEAMLELRKAA